MIELGELISSVGGWSNIYVVKDAPNMCVKVLAPHRKYQGEKPDPNLVAKKKYGIDNMLEFEYANYQKIIKCVPETLKKHFVRMEGMQMTSIGVRGLVMERVMTADGSTAPSLDHYKSTPLPDAFFCKLEQLRRDVFHKHSLDHFGVARRNVLVKDDHTPVLIDFQKNRRIYRSQINLYIPYFTRQKVTRNFQRLYREAQVQDWTTVSKLNCTE